MKLVVVSDLHPDKSTAGFPRFDDVESALATAVSHAVGIDADAFVFAGDLCNPESESLLRCLDMFAGYVSELDENGIPTIAIAGNHDVLEDGYGTTTLHPLRHVRGMQLLTKPDVYVGGRGAIVLLPYVATAFSYDPEQMLRELALRERRHVVAIVGHLMLEGISVGSETTDMPRGRDVFFPIELARELFPSAVLINGHYHRQQVYRGVHVPGSLCRFTREEAGNTPGYLEIEVP